jgi:hypothetical protein
VAQGVGNPQVIGGGGPAEDLELGSDARGMIARREASTWEGYQAKTAGQFVMGDGTDVISQALSGDISSVSSAGAVTLANPQKVQVSTVNLSAATIVGNTAGTLGHTSGITLVSAVASKRIDLIAVVIRYTHVVAAYTGGGNISALGQTTAIGQTGTVSAANSFAQADHATIILRPVAVNGGGTGSSTYLINEAIMLRSTAAFTQPGTAAGTAVVTTYYLLTDA